jgi:hypothetical protein
LHEADEFLFSPLLLVAAQGHRRGVFQHMNDTGHVDDAPTTTNYTTGKLCLDITQVHVKVKEVNLNIEHQKEQRRILGQNMVNFMDITHTGVGMNEELDDSLILVHQNMDLSQLSSLKTKQNSETALQILN